MPNVVGTTVIEETEYDCLDIGTEGKEMKMKTQRLNMETLFHWFSFNLISINFPNKIQLYMYILISFTTYKN